jgi:hypothetical protein
LEPSEDLVIGTGGAEALLDLKLPEEPDDRVVHVPRDPVQSMYIPAPWGLVDPLLNDLSQNARFYLYHCRTSLEPLQGLTLTEPSL